MWELKKAISISDSALEYCNSIINDSSKFPLIFEVLFSDVGRVNVIKVIRGLLQPKFESNTIRRVKDLNFRGIITTNYDKVIETALEGPDLWSLTNSEDDLKNIDHVIGSNVPFIIKIHGDIDNISGPEEETVRNGSPFMVISKSDYSFLQSRFDNLQASIHTLLVQGNFLFLGYGFNDPDIEFILNYLNQLIRFKYKSWFIGLKGEKQRSLPHNVELLTPIQSWDELPLWLDELSENMQKGTPVEHKGYEISGFEREALSALAEYLFSIESDNLHIKTLSSIVVAELVGKQKVLRSSIYECVLRILSVGRKWTESYSEAVIANLNQLGIIEQDGNYIIIKPQIHFLHKEVQKEITTEKDSFFKSIKNRLEEGAIVVENRFFEAFNSGLNDFCIEYGDSLARWIHRGISEDIHEKMIYEIYEKYYSSGEEVRFASELIKFIFNTPNESEIPYLYRLLRASILLSSIKLKPVASKYLRSTLESYELYLDANILLPLVIKEDNDHKWMVSIINTSQKAGVKFYALSDMVEEVYGHRNLSREFLKSFGGETKKLIQYSIAAGSSSNRFVNGYINEKQTNNISVEDYINKYSFTKIKTILNNLNIEVVDFKIDTNDPTYIYVKSKIEEKWQEKQKYYAGGRNPILNEHEAKQFICIYYLRNKEKKVGLPDDIWFLSYETVLENVYQLRPQEWQKPPTFRFSAWASFIDSYLMFKHEEGDSGSILKAIISSVSSRFQLPDALSIVRQRAFGNRMISTAELQALKIAISDGSLVNRFEKAQKGLIHRKKDTSVADEFEDMTTNLAAEVKIELSEKISTLQNRLTKLSEESLQKDETIEKLQKKYEKAVPARGHKRKKHNKR